MGGRMKIAGKTTKGRKIVNVYECEFCGKRSTDKEEIRRCELLCYHKEEAEVGLL